MLRQKDVLQWLQQLRVSQIKHIVSIKNQKHVDYISRIFSYQPNALPKEIMQHGISENTIQDQTCLYIRSAFRYKTNKNQKLAMDQLLLDNLTASRTNPCVLSVKAQFIKSGGLSECMMVLSDGQAFACFHPKYPNHKRGELNDSLWFQLKSISSFSQWVVHLFEREVLEAYSCSQAITKEITLHCFAQEQVTLEYVEESLRRMIASFVEKTIHAKNNTRKMQKTSASTIEVSQEEAPYLLKKCMQKVDNESMQLGEAVLEYPWGTSDPTQKPHQVIAQMSHKIIQRYHNYLIDLQAKHIEELTISRKKKKKNKNKEIHSTQATALQSNSSSQKLSRLKQSQEDLLSKKETGHLSQQASLGKKSLVEQLLIRKPQKRRQSPPKQQNIPNKVTAPSQNTPVMSLQTELALSKQQQLGQTAHGKCQQEVLIERMNEHMLSYYNQLKEASLGMEKHRKVCYEHIHKAIEQLQLKQKWKLQLFGSTCIELALKESDLDLVLITEEPACTLNDLQDLFKAREWLHECSIVQAAVPILQFQVILSQLNYPRQKDNKKQYQGVINVDINLWHGEKQHQGISSTLYQQNLFAEHPTLRPTALILKQLLRVYGLNRPYTGGIGSYILVILCRNIILQSKSESASAGIEHHLKAITHYLCDCFEPFHTIISSSEECSLQPDPTMVLNLEDPQNGTLLTVHVRQMHQIRLLFKQLQIQIERIRTELRGVPLEEQKKMKKIFFELWNDLFHRQE